VEQARTEVRVLEAATGHEGIDLAAAEAHSLVILDLGLPDGSGLDVCREIRRWSAAPIVVLSARRQDTENAALLDAGADDYMTDHHPADVRRRLKLESGDRVEFVEVDGAVAIKPASDDVRVLKRLLRTPAKAVSISQMNAAICARSGSRRSVLIETCWSDIWRRVLASTQAIRVVPCRAVPSRADFADCLIHRSAKAAGCDETVAFDKRAGMTLLK